MLKIQHPSKVIMIQSRNSGKETGVIQNTEQQEYVEVIASHMHS